MPGFNQKGLAPLILVVLALVGLVIGVWLVQNRTNFLPNAQFTVPNLTKETAFHLFLAGNFYLTNDGGGVAMSQDSGGGGSSDSMPTDGNTSGGSGGIMPRRTWFYPGEEIRVNLAVSSDIDHANTFSAIINFPTDLLEVVSIRKESNGSGGPVPQPYPIDTATEVVNSNTSQSSASVGSSESGNGTLTIPGRESCAAVVTRACIFDTVMCIKAPCPPQQRCEDFPSQCDVPPGWDIVEDGGGFPRNCNPYQDSKECKRGYYCKPNSTCNSDNSACTDVEGGTCVIANRPSPTIPPACPMYDMRCEDGTISTYVGDNNNGCPLYKCIPIPNPSPIDCRMVDCAPRAISEGCHFVSDGSCCGGDVVCKPYPSCKPRPPCLDSNPRCMLPETPDMCPPNPGYIQDYFIRFWLPDTGFDNDKGRITLAGGVSGGGILTTPPSKPVMATIIFKAKKAGEAIIYIADESVILRNSDSSNILTNKNKLMVQVQEKPVPPVIRGDLDGDGIVGFVDFSILLTNWGTDSKKADITGDGKVDIFDFSVMLTNWSGRRGIKLIQRCPEEWIQNMMPGIIDDGNSSSTPGEYYILEGKRREISEFDLDWVKGNCNIKPQSVY